MHKGTKLGPRDRWQININYCKRNAYQSYRNLQYYKKRLFLKKQLAELDPPTEEDIKELAELENSIRHAEWKYKEYLEQFQFYSERKKHALRNIAFITPYVEKYGEKAGFIYVFKTIEERPIYKIGKTRNLKSRTVSYNAKGGAAKVPFEYIFIFHTEEVDLVERMLVEVFKDKVAWGKEWFYFSAEDLELIQKIFKWSLDNQK